MLENVENSAVATWLERSFSLQSCKKVISKNVQLPHSCTHLTYYQSNFSKQVFNSTWTVSFHMFKLESRLPGEISITSICRGEGNGIPLQYSCLENPMDGGAWWAAVHGIAKSWTGLKQLSSSSSRYADDTTLMAEREELKNLLMKVRVKKLAQNSAFRKLRSWRPVPSHYSK